MPTQNINLSEKQAAFVRQSIHGGRYRSASEVLRAGLRLLEQQERQDTLKLKILRRLATDAFDEIDRGKFETVDPDNLDDLLARVDTKARTSKRG
jgi:antitoxin ParD1/3/4